ncbi:MAG: hypothetical protein R3293_21365, partial [Candidatus Promineifilaceae bacterium]|nr:hypothetical protein [Candidatus Promineifilaceae bacterium]
VDPEAAADPEGSLLEFIEMLGLTLSDVQLVGPETLDGRETFVYSYTETLGELTAQNRVWLGVNDGRLYRTESISELNGENLLTLAVYEYDVPLVIEAPQINEGG